MKNMNILIIDKKRFNTLNQSKYCMDEKNSILNIGYTLACMLDGIFVVNDDDTVLIMKNRFTDDHGIVSIDKFEEILSIYRGLDNAKREL